MKSSKKGQEVDSLGHQLAFRSQACLNLEWTLRAHYPIHFPFELNTD